MPAKQQLTLEQAMTELEAIARKSSMDIEPELQRYRKERK